MAPNDPVDVSHLHTPRLVYKGEHDLLGSGLIGERKRVEDQAALKEALADGWRLTAHNPDDDAADRAAAKDAKDAKEQGRRDAVARAAAAQQQARADVAARQPVAEAQAANDAAKADAAANPPKPKTAAEKKAAKQADATATQAAADAAANAHDVTRAAAPRRNALKK